jgi:hypothetical protein
MSELRIAANLVLDITTQLQVLGGLQLVGIEEVDVKDLLNKLVSNVKLKSQA